MESAEVLALVGGHVEAEILLRNEYLAAENAILKSKLEGRLRFTHEERVRLAKIGKQLGRKALADVGPIVKPDTILKWFRELVAKKFDGSKHRRYPRSTACRSGGRAAGRPLCRSQFDLGL
jgi:hypothetical protein